MWLMPPFYIPLRGRWWAPLHDSGTSYDKTGKPRLWRYRENMQTRLRLWEMHPYRCCAPLLHGKASHLVLRSLCSPTNQVRLPPRKGKSALHLLSCSISCSRHHAAKISPSGGDVAAGDRRGAFPTPARAVVWFSLRPPGRFACFPTGEARLYGFPSHQPLRHQAPRPRSRSRSQPQGCPLCTF